MGTEHDRRLKRKLPDPVVASAHEPLGDAATLEAETAAQYERDRTPQLPESVEDLLTATLGEAGLSGLTELQTRFVRDEAALLASTSVEQRLRRYLFEGETTTPSRYARALVQGGRGIEQMTAADRRTLAELQFYLVSELNPLLQQWHEAVHSQVSEADPLRTTDGLIEALSYGNVPRGQIREQRTISAIGLLRQLSATQTDFVPFQIEAKTHPQHLVVEQPLGEETKDYWRTRVECAQLYGASEPNEMIGWRTRHLQIVLEEAAAAVPNVDTEPEQQRLVAAYDTIADWLEAHAEAMEQPLQIDASEVDRATFDYYMSRMDFTHGDTNEIIALLNAAEVIKQHNPELFMRMVGIAPNPLAVDQEANRSDLFGSAFHVALYRTLQLDHPRFQSVHMQVKQLTELEAKAKPLTHLNGAQVRQIAAKFKEVALADKPDNMLITMIATTFASLIARHPREVALALMLNSVEQDSRTETLERLQAAGARDFVTMIQSAPEVLLAEPECVAIVQRRLELDTAQAAREQIRFMREWNQRLPSARFGYSGRQQYKDFNWDIKTTLWKTADDAALLTEDFWVYLDEARNYVYNHTSLPAHYDIWHARTQQDVPLYTEEWKKDTRNEKHAEMNDRILQAVRRAVSDHPQISKTQWLEWYRTSRGLPGKGIAAGPADKDGKREAIQALAAKMHGHGEYTTFNDTSFAVVLGPDASSAFTRESDMDQALGPAVAGALGQGQRIEAIIAARARAYPRSTADAWPELDAELMTPLRDAYRFLSTERFVQRYREPLIRLGADYIMELRTVASEADFAELVEQLYFLPDGATASTDQHLGGYNSIVVKYPEAMLAPNPWQLEVYDTLERWVKEDPTSRTACQAELTRLDQQFFTRTDFRIYGWHDYGTGQTGQTYGAVSINRQLYPGGDGASWYITEDRGRGYDRNFGYREGYRDIHSR